MGKLTRWLFAAAALACLPNASAATYNVIVEQEKTYADEVITGTDTTIDYYRDQGPQLGIALDFTPSDAERVKAGDVIALTFTLINARFAARVRASDLRSRLFDVQEGGIRVRPTVADGEQGDTSATFELEAPDDWRCDSGCDIEMRFEVPELTGLTRDASTGAVNPVTWQVSTAASGGSGWPDTKTAGVGASSRCDDGDYCVRSEDGVLQFMQPLAEGASRQEPFPFVRFMPGLTFSATSTGASRIDLAGGRLGFTGPSQANLGHVRLGLSSAAACTGRAPTSPICPRQSDGMEFTIDRGGEGRGTLDIAVAGDFREGDQVWLDLDGNDEPAANELLNLAASGSMQRSFRLDDVAGNANAAEGDAGDLDREQGVATHDLIYRPNGSDPLRPGAFRSRYAVDFETAIDKPTQPATGEHAMRYAGISETRRVHAIAPLAAEDLTSVRIKCEVIADCIVYLECDDAAGNSWFGRLAPIDGRSTRVLNQQAVAESLGTSAAGWEDMLACTAYATRDISVQVFNRSSGTLVSTTYVDSD